MFLMRRKRSGWPCGRLPRWVIFAEVNSIADAFGQAATQAPQPMQVALSKALSACNFGARLACASGAEPVLTEMKPPAWMIRSIAVRSTTKSLITGNA